MPITIRQHPDYIPARDIGTRTEAVTQFRDLRLDISIRLVELCLYRHQMLSVASAQLMRLFVESTYLGQADHHSSTACRTVNGNVVSL